MVSLTERALHHIRQVREAEARTAEHLRLRVLPGGCSGFSYDFGWDAAAPTARDEVWDFDGVRVVVDRVSLAFIDRTEIDYEPGLYGAGFVFRNPQSAGGCGCGRSFTA